MIRRILQLKDKGLGIKAIAKSLGVSKNTVKKYAREYGDGLEAAPARVETGSDYQAAWSTKVDWSAVKAETDAGEQLSRIHEESFVGSVDTDLRAVPYVSFWREFRRRYPNVPLDFHKYHPPGERCEVDYKGDAAGLGYVDRNGNFIQCRLFGTILTFSQRTFMRATETERQPDMLESLAAAYQYFGGVPRTSAVDNTRAAVNRAHRYDPDLNPEFSRFCEHFDTAPLAMRPRKPKDKNLIENAHGVFWRWSRRRIAQRTFHSLDALNGYLVELLNDFNNRVQRKYGLSRNQRFEAGEREKLLPLPTVPYFHGTWKKAKLHPDCHIQVDYNFYSAPYQLRSKELDVRVTRHMLEVFHGLDRVACHVKASSNGRGRYVTKESHLPPAQKAMMEACPRGVLVQAEDVGIATSWVIANLLDNGRHPLMFLRRAQGILRLKSRYSAAVLEGACQVIKDLGIELPRLADIEDIAKNHKLGKARDGEQAIERKPNPNLRGQMSWSSSSTKH